MLRGKIGPRVATQTYTIGHHPHVDNERLDIANVDVNRFSDRLLARRDVFRDRDLRVLSMDSKYERTNVGYSP